MVAAPVGRGGRMAMTSLAVGWCTYFRRRGLTWYTPLRHAGRAPGLFATGSPPAACDVRAVAVDEFFVAHGFDGRHQRRADGLDVVYACAYGQRRQSWL